MKQCKAVAFLPPPDHVIALAAPGHRPEPGHVLCELGEDHENHKGDADHAAMLWDEGGRYGGAVWARWNTERTELVPLPWCSALDSRNEACGLFAGHPPPHSWEVTDPTDEAITRVLAERHPHLFPERRERGGG
ncbi:MULTISPECIES: hypothetical protein [Streptomyces]|uniref:hypothetical protein n=1 Tax=Streptomyces TaxID=1883 RepID=UPI0013D98A55|nr:MULTISPECIES: hypothetical protein [Streptomyces]NDZ63666.1 hypothetical protein [Streptomyces cyaneofuscatus]CAD5946175.1 conserved protein of unknown function [Streptomyces sp. KY75]CAD5986297.1 conserved protein of unknown function [Streptomyces sp. KY70]